MNIKLRKLKSSQSLRLQFYQFVTQLSSGIDRRLVTSIAQMAEGMLISGSFQLTQIARDAVRRCRKLKDDHKRLQRLLTLGQAKAKVTSWTAQLRQHRLQRAAQQLKKGTPIAVDLSHIERPYAKQTEGVCRVWDGEKTVRGHWWLQATAIFQRGRHGKRRLLPLLSNVFSHVTPDFVSENQTILTLLAELIAVIPTGVVFLFDRGFDRIRLIQWWLLMQIGFVVRIDKDREVELPWGQQTGVEGRIGLAQLIEIARYPFKKKVWINKRLQPIRIGFCEVELPGLAELGIDTRLWLVYSRGGPEEWLLLTNQAVRNRRDVERILRWYQQRWGIEAYFRDLKENLGVEEVRVRSLAGVNQLMELAMVIYSFALKVLRGGGRRLAELVKAGGKLEITGKEERTMGRLMNGMGERLKELRSVEGVIPIPG